MTPRWVEVLWYDAENITGWRSASEVADLTLPLVPMRGYLVRSDKKMVVISMTPKLGGEYLGLQSIPRGMVKSIRTLRVK